MVEFLTLNVALAFAMHLLSANRWGGEKTDDYGGSGQK